MQSLFEMLLNHSCFTDHFGRVWNTMLSDEQQEGKRLLKYNETAKNSN